MPWEATGEVEQEFIIFEHPLLGSSIFTYQWLLKYYMNFLRGHMPEEQDYML